MLDGRDIGTVICPDADVKLFIQADSKARMERRARQFEARGQVVDRYALYHQIEERDARDMANPNGGFYKARRRALARYDASRYRGRTPRSHRDRRSDHGAQGRALRA